MNKKKILHTILCILGSIMIGYFANQLSTLYGSILFVIGIILLVYSSVKLNKNLMKEIYNEAIKQTQIPKLYEDLCLEYYQQMKIERTIKKNKAKEIIKK